MKRFLKIATISLVLIFGFLIWYKYTYSMDIIAERQVNNSIASKKILIASQGSEFKNALVDALIEDLKKEDVFIQVIDVTTINTIEPNQWDLLMIFHTFEIWEPQKDAAAFLDKSYDKSKMIILATSGSGDLMIEGVDGITGASILDEVATKKEIILTKAKLILGIE